VVPLAASEQWVKENPQAELLPVNSGHELLDVLDVVWDQSRDFLMRTPTRLADTF